MLLALNWYLRILKKECAIGQNLHFKLDIYEVHKNQNLI